MAPTGNFYLPPESSHEKHYIAFAAGSGITPVMSILKTILKEEPQSRFTLIYGNRTRSSVIFREELLDMKNNYPGRFQWLPVFSREKMDAPIFEGRIDAGKCEMIFKEIVPLAEDQEYLICGPSEMIFTVRDWLKARNIEEKKIHFELFSDPGEINAVEKKPVSEEKNLSEKKSLVSIRLDGVSADFQMPFDGPNILELATRAGADLPYACRAGVCATCRAKLVEAGLEWIRTIPWRKKKSNRDSFSPASRTPSQTESSLILTSVSRAKWLTPLPPLHKRFVHCTVSADRTYYYISGKRYCPPAPE